jgi:hypothetical protein
MKQINLSLSASKCPLTCDDEKPLTIKFKLYLCTFYLNHLNTKINVNFI